MREWWLKLKWFFYGPPVIKRVKVTHRGGWSVTMKCRSIETDENWLFLSSYSGRRDLDRVYRVEHLEKVSVVSVDKEEEVWVDVGHSHLGVTGWG